MKKLIWDSNYWGIEIFNIDEECFEQKILPEDIKSIEGTYLVQALISDSEISKINFLIDKGFKFVESKISLKKFLEKEAYITRDKFKEVEKCDFEDKKGIFYDLYGKVSRFSIFDKEKVNNFYYTWVMNSIDGKMDDKCVGYYIDNHLAGFVTFKYKNSGITIGLVGVFPEFQRMGISRKLLGYVNNEAINQGIKNISISTQGKNIKAINAYIKEGFQVESVKHWYYMKKGD